MESKLAHNCENPNEYSSQKTEEVQISEKELSLNHQIALLERELEKKNRELFLAKEKLNKIEEQFNISVELCSSSCFILNKEGIIKLVNQRGAELLRSKKELLVSKSFFEFITQNNKSKFAMQIKNVFKYKTENSCKILIQRQYNKKILVNIKFVPLTIGLGEEENCILVIKKDKKINAISNSDEISIGNTPKHEKYYNENFVRDKFFSIIAHDLKSPLSGLLGFSQILETEYDKLTNYEKREFIGHVNTAAKNLNSLLENLLEWSRIQIGGMLVKPELFNLNSAVNEIINLFAQNAVNKHISFKKEIDSSLTIFADKNSFLTILRNLISNAIKFSNDNGTVNVVANDSDDFVKIIIEDKGIGISEKNVQKLFRIDLNYTTIGTSQERGTGLGLIICKELVEKNGGKIWVESQMGRGTKMIFTLPKSSSKIIA